MLVFPSAEPCPASPLFPGSGWDEISFPFTNPTVYSQCVGVLGVPVDAGRSLYYPFHFKEGETEAQARHILLRPPGTPSS